MKLGRKNSSVIKLRELMEKLKDFFINLNLKKSVQINLEAKLAMIYRCLENLVIWT